VRSKCVLLLLAAGCASAPVASQEQGGTGRGACAAGVLTYECREREWPLLREDPQAALAALDDQCSTASSGWACLELGLTLSRWRNLPRDEKRALEAFEASCTLHVGQGCAAAALMYEAGRGAKRDVARARGLYGRACLIDFRPACADRRRLVELPTLVAREGGADGLQDEEIAWAMELQRGPVQYCFAFALEREPPLAEKASELHLEFTVDAAGRAGPSKVSGTIDEPLAFCVSEAVRAFEFPRPRGSTSVLARHSYVFPPSFSPAERTAQPAPRPAGAPGAGPDERLNAPQRTGGPIRR
jgi:hypothetical protein